MELDFVNKVKEDWLNAVREKQAHISRSKVWELTAQLVLNKIAVCVIAGHCGRLQRVCSGIYLFRFRVIDRPLGENYTLVTIK